MSAADVALVALVSLTADLDAGRLTATDDTREVLNYAMELLAQIGDEHEER